MNTLKVKLNAKIDHMIEKMIKSIEFIKWSKFISFTDDASWNMTVMNVNAINIAKKRVQPQV